MEQPLLLLSSVNLITCLQQLYCNFVVWSENDGLIVEQIETDEAFFQSLMMFNILSEIVGKWYIYEYP